MALRSPRLVDLDDPLQPRSAPAVVTAPQAPPADSAPPAKPRRRPRSSPATDKTPPATPAPSASTLADEQLVAVFARVPESLSDRLADTVRALNTGRARRARVSQQDIVGALLERYATPVAPDELTALVDDYRQRLRR
jgi:hypothetical protein